MSKTESVSLENLLAPIRFIGAVAVSVPQVFRKRNLRSRDFLYYLDLCGTRSLGVVLLISALMGMVLALQGALQLRKVGTDIFIVDLVGFAVLKEFGPLIVSIDSTGANMFEENKVIFNEKKAQVLADIVDNKKVSFIK